MRRTVFAFLVVLLLASLAFAQHDETRRSQDGGGQNSQLIYIRVTMAGAFFTLTNGEWVIGDAGAPTPWYAFPQNIYQNAGGPWYGAGSLYGRAWAPDGDAPYSTGVFKDDVPILHNVGGVALDFFLYVSPSSGRNYNFLYESAHSSNIMDAAQYVSAASNYAFRNGVQVRATFVSPTMTADYGNPTNAGSLTMFPYCNPLTPNERFNENLSAGLPPGGPSAKYKFATVVLSTAFFTTPGHTWGYGMTGDYGWATTHPLSWAEATSYRFTPNGTRFATDLQAADNPATQGANAKGIGLLPGGRVDICMEFLTPYEVTNLYQATTMGKEQLVLLRVVGTPSDAH